MAKKIGLEMQITGDVSSLNAALSAASLEMSKLSNIDISPEFKVPPEEIRQFLAQIYKVGDQAQKLLTEKLSNNGFSEIQTSLANQIDAAVDAHLKAFKKVDMFSKKTAEEIKQELKAIFTADMTSSMRGQIRDVFDEVADGAGKSKGKIKDLFLELNGAASSLKNLKDEAALLNTEITQVSRATTQASEKMKSLGIETARAFDGITTKSTHAATGMAKEFNRSIESMSNGVKNLQRLSKKGIVDTKDTVKEIARLEGAIDSMKKSVASNVGQMTNAQISHANRAVEAGQRKLATAKSSLQTIEDTNSRHRSQSAVRAMQTQTWDKINKIDTNFSNAKEQVTTGNISKVNLRSLAGQLGNMTKYTNQLKQAQLEAEAAGDIPRAQAIQELVTAAESKYRAHRQTYGAMSNRFGSYDDAVRGQLGTSQATRAASVLNNRKGSMTHATMMLGQGQLLDASTLSTLSGYGAELKNTESALKKKLKDKDGSQEQLEEVKRYLKLIREEREKHRIDMEKIAIKQAKNEEKIQRDKDAEALKEQKRANAQKYADMVSHLAKNQHLIEAMSTKELRDTRSMLRGARVAMAGDPDSVVTISSLQDAIGEQLKAGDKPTVMDTVKKKLGFGKGGTPFNNKRLNAFHGLNHKITNVAQMTGTSLYGMGAVGLGSAIISGTMEKAAELDTVKLTIAGMVNTYSQFIDAQGKSVSNAENLNKSIEYSGILYGKLRDAAKSSLMTTGEMAEGFLTGAPRLRERGFSDEQAIEITKKIMMLGRATGLTSTAIMSDIRDFAAGKVNSRSQVLMTAGLDADVLKEKFKTGGSQAAFDYFQERMSSFDATFKKIADTPAGQLNAFKIEIEQLSQTMGEKLAPILIPQLQKFRELISDWVTSGQAERFIVTFGEFVSNMTTAMMKFMDFIKPWMSDFNTLMTVTITGIFSAMVANIAIQAVAMSNPVTAIIATLGTLVYGIIKLRQAAENNADGMMKDLYDQREATMGNTVFAKTQTLSELDSGTFGKLTSDYEFYKKNEKDIKSSENFARTFMNLESDIRKGVYDGKNGRRSLGASNMKSMFDMADAFVNIDPYTKTRIVKGDKQLTNFDDPVMAELYDRLKAQGYDMATIQSLAEATKKIRNNTQNLSDAEFFTRLTAGQQRKLGGQEELNKLVAKLRPRVLKELNLDKAVHLYPSDEARIQKKTREIIISEDYAYKNKQQPNAETDAGKAKTSPMGPKLTTLEDVLKTYAQGQNEILQQRIGNTSDVAMSGGQYLKPILLGRGLSAGVTQAVSTWKDAIVDNREKGPYALAQANAQLTNTMEQLRNSFLENIRTVAANIATQKEQNRVLKENVSLQQKANQLENAKFELSQIKPYDLASGAAYVTKAIGVANMQRNYSVAQANAGVSQSMSEQAIANIKYLDENGLLDTLSTDQQAIYRRAMSGDTSAIGKLPPGILSQNLRQFSTGAEVSGSIAQANRGGGSSVVGGASQWKSSIKGLAKGMGLSVSSEYRPGAKTHAKGSASWHSKSEGKEHGLAIDFAGTKKQMASFFDAVRSTYGDGAIRELIYTPKGAVFNGKYVRTFNPITMKDHYDHVHVALKGGKSVDMKAVEAKMPSQDRGEGAMSDQISGINPVTGMPIGAYQSESMPPMLSEWFSMNGQLAGLKADGAFSAANNQATSDIQQALTAGMEPAMALMQFQAQQRLGMIGLSGNALADRLRINKADTAIFEAQNKGGQYMLGRQQGFQGALSQYLADFDSNPDAFGNISREDAIKSFTEGYIKKTTKGYGDIINPAAENKARIDDAINRKNDYLNNMQQIVEKAAANLERLAEIDFSQLVQFVQNPYARIGSVVNPGQALAERTQRTMDKAIADSDLAVDKEEMVMKGLGLYNQIIAKDPNYFLNKRRAGRTRARQVAGDTMSSQAVAMALAGARNGVGANFLNTNFYGALTGSQNFDIASVLSPLTGLGAGKFDQSADILVGLANGTLDLEEIAKNPALADILKQGGKAGLKKYAMGNMLGKIGGNIAGNYVGNQIFAGKDPAAISSGTDIGGALAAAGTFGSKFAGPAGIIAGSIFGGLVGGLFGGKKANPDEERFRERQRQHFDKMEKMAEETNKLLRPSYDVYNTIKGDMLYGSASRFYSNRAYSPLGNQITTGAN